MTCSGLGADADSLNVDGVVELDELSEEEQLAVISVISAVTVVLSETMRNVVLVEFDRNAAVIIGPPGRLVFEVSPYYE